LRKLAFVMLSASKRISSLSAGPNPITIADSFFGGMRIALQQAYGSHNHAGSAVTALLGNKCLLERMERIALGEAFDRFDFAADDGADARGTGENRPAVCEHGTGPALSLPATVLSAGEPEILAQHVE
jgi:hypothetical protein